jgi:antitoxin component YwqK of YwqJK toxin-antitoxin module
VPEPTAPPVETVRYPNGKVKFTGAHLDGEMHGPWEFFRADGSLMRAGSFDGGRQVGIWRTYGRTGRVVKETRFDEVISP